MGIALNEMISTACLGMRRSYEACLGRARKTDNLGLKKLLLSIVDQEKENEMRLAELKASGGPMMSIEFADFTTNETAPEVEVARDKDLLLLLLDQKTKLSELFSRLASQCRDADLAHFFRVIAEDELKQRALVQDRYDLEVLR